MHKKELRGWIKHIDFIVLDVVILQVCFVLSYWIWVGFENPYDTYLYRYQAILLLLCQLLTVLFTDSYKNILRRNRVEEFIATFRFEVIFMLLEILFLFMVHQIYMVSRMFTGIMAVMYLFASYFMRLMNKKRIFNSAKIKVGKKSLMVMTSASLAGEVIKNLLDNSVHDYKITGVYLMDRECSSETIRDIPGTSYAVTQRSRDAYLPPLVQAYLLGLTAMLLYALVSTLLLRKKVSVSLRQRGNICVCDDVASPFILGILRPVIYLPSS